MSEATSKQLKKQAAQSSPENSSVVSQNATVTQSQNNSQNQWVLQTPEYLLLIVVALILWTLGFIDMINHISTNRTILGLYSTSYFVLLVTYSLGFGVWIALLARPSHSGWLTKSVTTIQRTPWLAATSLGLIAFLIWTLMTILPETAHPLSSLSEIPVVPFVFVCLLLMAGALIIFGGWGQVKPVQLWRKILALLIGAIIVIEVFLQVLAGNNYLPGTQKIADLFVPYGKIYSEHENLTNGRLNNYGWYYPDFNTTDKSKRVLILGDTFVQALQISQEQHLGVFLDEMITNNTEEEVQVMALGYPGFGPGLYLNTRILPYPVGALNPNEIVVIVQLGSDLDNITVPEDGEISFNFNERGEAKIHPDPDNFTYWHDLSHFVISGFRPLDPLEVLQANYLTPKVLNALRAQTNTQETLRSDAPDKMAMPGFKAAVTEWGPLGEGYTTVLDTELYETPGASNYLFQNQPGPEAEEALAIMNSLIKQANDYAVSNDIRLRMVTIPAFPETFYQEYKDDPWQPEIGNLDLFYPDRELQAFAKKEGIPFLSMGQYMYKNELATNELKLFYYQDGLGHFTPLGHEYLAKAIYSCFYSETIDEACSN